MCLHFVSDSNMRILFRVGIIATIKGVENTLLTSGLGRVGAGTYVDFYTDTMCVSNQLNALH